MDLNPPKDGEEDKRTPYFIVPQYVTNPHQSAALSMALALEGQKVHVMTYPEEHKMAKPPADWLERVKEEGTLALHAKLAKKVAKGMGIERPNLMGFSMGAAIALEMASDSGYEVNDLIVMEPPTVIHKGTLKQLADFGVIEGIPAVLNAEDRLKTVLSDRPEVTGVLKGTERVMVPLLAKKQIDDEKLQRINPKGRYQVWLGGDSAITGEKTEQAFVDAEKGRIAANPDASPLEVYRIEGVGHGVITHSMGMTAEMISEERPAETVTILKGSDLDNSAAAAIVNH